MKKSTILCLAGLFAALSCSRQAGTGWTAEEKSLIDSGDSVMRVLVISSREDSLFLREKSGGLSPEMLRAPEYETLAAKLVATVTSPEQGGVGIAGPQVGIGRRIVAVQRFDKEGEPFEVFPNIRIAETRGEKVPGGEGCLSVPAGYVPGTDTDHGTVDRWQDITIAYTSPFTLSDTTENVSGFTAVIFQHETDHLDGILYIDYIQ